MIDPGSWEKPNSFLRIANGELPEKASFLSIDSRKIKNHDSFLCLKGERFDGHDFLNSIAQKKISVIVYEKSSYDKVSKYFDSFKTCWVEVEDSLVYFQELSKCHIDYWKKEYSGKVIAISGSNGKTTTRYMISHLFKEVYSEDYIVTNQKNNNNHIGVPLTIMDISSKSKVAIIELGSNSPGEIEVVCNIAQPDYSFVTNIGATHLEFFDGVDDVFKEESFPYAYSKQSQKVFFLNTEDDYLKKLDLDNFVVPLEYEKIENKFIQGSYNFYNLSMAFQIASHIDSGRRKEFFDAAASFKPTENRGEWLKRNDCEVFLDAYNANPDSMRASMEGFLSSVNKDSFLFIVGDMNELGTDTRKYHQELGEWIKSKNIQNVVFIGQYHSFYKEGYPGSRSYKTREDYSEDFKKDTLQFRKIFIKGSRSLALEKLL